MGNRYGSDSIVWLRNTMGRRSRSSNNAILVLSRDCLLQSPDEDCRRFLHGVHHSNPVGSYPGKGRRPLCVQDGFELAFRDGGREVSLVVHEYELHAVRRIGKQVREKPAKLVQ
jgi:hypothetical protein